MSDTPITSTKTESVSEVLREFLLIGEFGVRVYIWHYNSTYRKYQRVHRVYNGVHSTRPVRCRTSAESPSSRLVMRNVRLYTKSGSIFLLILFNFALILADCKFIAKLKKKNGDTACHSSLPLFERLSAKSPHFLFSDLELEASVVYESKRRITAKPHSVSGAAECEYVNCSTYGNLLGRELFISYLYTRLNMHNPMP